MIAEIQNNVQQVCKEMIITDTKATVKFLEQYDTLEELNKAIEADNLQDLLKLPESKETEKALLQQQILVKDVKVVMVVQKIMDTATPEAAFKNVYEQLIQARKKLRGKLAVPQGVVAYIQPLLTSPGQVFNQELERSDLITNYHAGMKKWEVSLETNHLKFLETHIPPFLDGSDAVTP